MSVELRGVSVQRGAVRLENLNFSLKAGERWLLTGANGSGKSTLLALLRGEWSPQAGTRRYFLEGQWRSAAVRAKVLLPLVSPDQEAFYLQRDTVQSVADVLYSGLTGEALRLWEPSPAAALRLQEVAALLRLEPLLERDIRTLSHGQRRRALLGRALMPRPAALLLDELTDGLSPAARQELGDVLAQVSAQGTALLLVTHRPAEAPSGQWQCAHLEAGQLTVLEPYTAPPSTSSAPKLSRLAALPNTPPPYSREPLVILQNASVYRNGLRALGPISWQWRRGEHWLVTGENGAGKSTFARLVAGEFHPALGGQVARPFLRRDLLSERQRRIGLLGAEVGIRQRRDWTGHAVLASGFGGSVGFAPLLSETQESRLQEVAAQLGATELLTRPADTLSQGQLRRLLLGRAIIHRPTLLILDEGVDFLDENARQQFWALLPDLLGSGTHLMVISHHAADVPAGLTHHLELAQGLMVKD